jgi:hypothetical protein
MYYPAFSRLDLFRLHIWSGLLALRRDVQTRFKFVNYIRTEDDDIFYFSVLMTWENRKWNSFILLHKLTMFLVI